MRATNILLLIIFGAIALAACIAYAGPLDETRYCGPPARNADGSIKRRADVLAKYRQVIPCPSTGLHAGACPGWSLDHVWPLAACGCDSVENIHWLNNAIKSCAGTQCKDRWERWVYSCDYGRLIK